MENPEANQLPEVDSLPDGFVDSSPEPLAPPTPTFEQEKPLGNHEDDNASEMDRSKEPVDELGANEFQTSQERAEKTPKLRTFPVPLSETDSLDSSVESVEVPKKASTEQTAEGSLVMPGSADSVSEAAIRASGCVEVKEQAEARCESSERPTEGGSDAPTTNLKEISASESVETLKNRKPDTTETKRKNPKRTFKSEKEFIEFTLKYQQVLAERDGAIAVRDKLESLCRELQRQNKMLMDECRRVSTEGQNLRLELSTKFQDAIKDVSNKLDEQKDECISQLKENEMLSTKLQQLTYQHAHSEQQYETKLKQKSLELQIADLKIKQHEEKIIQEQSQMKLYAEQVSQLLATEKTLRLQLTADGEKFQQFQDALLKSNEVFETFKQEIEKMAKSIKELKKENVFLKSKCDKTDVTLIELVDEFTMELAATESANTPKRYILDMSKDFVPMSVFSESSQGKLCVEGNIKDKFDMKPNDENLENYGKLCRERTKKHMKSRKIQVIDNDNGARMRPMPGMIGFVAPGPSEKKKAPTKGSEMKRTRRDRGEMEDIMFKLFERQPNWTLRQLIQETDQPEQFLKDILKELSVYNNKGANQGTYELKPEYRRTSEDPAP